jgi:pSer/pThr/pTyr-binding forkhead associated (FHA) protein
MLLSRSYRLPVCVCRPYIIDLESANGTFINGEKIEPAKYYELLEKVQLLSISVFARRRRRVC